MVQLIIFVGDGGIMSKVCDLDPSNKVKRIVLTII